MKKQKSIDRLIREKGICPHCLHDKARSSIIGTFCMRCKKDINILPEESKPMRVKGLHPKANFRGRRKK